MGKIYKKLQGSTGKLMLGVLETDKMGLFWKSSDEKKRVEEERIKAEQEQQKNLKQQEEYREMLLQVIITPETKEQYESRVGYAVEIIDTGERNKGVMITQGNNFLPERKLWKQLAESGIEAIVQTTHSYYVTDPYYHRVGYYGLPVARKKGGPYR